jgi:hypothetical protein
MSAQVICTLGVGVGVGVGDGMLESQRVASWCAVEHSAAQRLADQHGLAGHHTGVADRDVPIGSHVEVHE